eukprot:g295.t1
MTHRHLANREDKFWKELGNKCLHFTWSDRGKIQLKELGLEVVEDINNAEFVLVHGTDAFGRGDENSPVPSSFEDMTQILQQCNQISRKLPMIVANPDFVTVDGSEMKIMPGSFGKAYEAMGGTVHYMGKPGPFVYTHTLNMMDLTRDQVVAIGDSMEHDIKGANAMGIDSILVCNGIHKEELRNGEREITAEAVSKLSQTYDLQPTFYIDLFRI